MSPQEDKAAWGAQICDGCASQVRDGFCALMYSRYGVLC